MQQIEECYTKSPNIKNNMKLRGITGVEQKGIFEQQTGLSQEQAAANTQFRSD